MNEIPTELLSHIASFLWFKDIASLSFISKETYHKIHSDGLFWMDLVESIMHLSFFETVNVRPFLQQISGDYLPQDFVRFLKHLILSIPAFSPRVIDTKILSSYRGPEGIRVVGLDEMTDRTTILFSGTIEESVRSIVANDCFPYLPTDAELMHVSFPFTKVVATDTSPQSMIGARTIGEVVLSQIGYFECAIQTDFCPPETSPASLSLTSRQSFSIGLACPPFTLKGQLPGSDNFSLGYRSDDGAFCQGGINGIQFGGEPYGAGDTVGCGLIYPSLDLSGKGKLFFTRNGQLQGRILEIASASFFCIPWFPVLVSHLQSPLSPLLQGIDSYHPVSMNFGQEKFVFDILGYEQSLRQALRQPEVSLPNLASSHLALRVLKLHHESFGTSPSGSPQPVATLTMSSSPPSLMAHISLSTAASSKVKPASRFSSNSLLHRSLRIIDAQIYKFQVPLLISAPHPSLTLHALREIFSLIATAITISRSPSSSRGSLLVDVFLLFPLS
jgi:hypothetical protein